MNFLCPSCRTPLPRDAAIGLVTCTQCSVQVDLTRVDTAPGQARLWPEVDLKGETVSGHLLIQRIGSGGMGTVYEAESPVGQAVAMKVLSPMLAAEPALRERFRREARALTKVEHPRVVRLFEEGEDRGFCWYSMELVKGLDLKHRIEKGVMSAAEVDALAVTLLEALAAVHEAGVVHRDIKPSNVLMGPEGPRLCDFGIAQVSGATTLTESAALLGSLRYMAPEQRWGKADDRSDLYALGVVLHECLSGGVPGEQPLPSSVPAYLAKFIGQLTAQNPSSRPLSAVEATKRLGQLRKGALSKLVVGGAVGGVAVLIGAVLLLVGGSSDKGDDRTSERAAIVDDAGVDAGRIEVDAGSLDAGNQIDAGILQPAGFLTVRTLGAESVIIDDRPPVALRDGFGVPLVVEPLTLGLSVGSHSVVFNCPTSGKAKGTRSSLPFIVKVPEFPAVEVTWNCATMKPMTKADRLKAATAGKPLPGKPPPVKAPPVKPGPKPVAPSEKKKKAPIK